MAGLYPPGAGSVLWDDGDLAQFDPAALRARMAVLFQDFVRYQLSALGEHRLRQRSAGG